MRFLFIVVLLFPFVVFSQEKIGVQIIVDSERFADLFFDVAQGSVHDMGIVVKNSGEESEEIRLSIKNVDGEDVQSLATRTRFYSDTLDAHLQQQIVQNNNKVSAFCAKSNDNAKEWCEGLDRIVFIVGPGEEFRVPVTIAIDSDAHDHEAVLVAERKGDEGYVFIEEKHMVYHVPDKNIARIHITNFALEKKSKPLDFGAWFRAGMKDEYIARFAVENVGTEDVSYTYRAEVDSQWIGESVVFEGQDNLAYGKKQENALVLTMPRFGKMRVIGGIVYGNGDDVLKESVSEPIDFVVWPLKLAVLFLCMICFCAASVLLYTYIRKNMFGRKKKKKKKKGDLYTGTYVVQDADNIISIAQRYGVPWKDLAVHNDIKSPYVLISGETIQVPGGDTDDGKDEDVKEKEDEKVTTQEGNEKKIAEDSSDDESLIELGETETAEAPVGMGDVQHIPSQRSAAASIGEPVQMSAEEDSIKNVAKTQRQLQQEPKKKAKRKITFASPKNMLTKLSSEPTTRAIDIEWMRDDEATYLEEMEEQEKKTNRLFMISSVVIVILVGLGVWWGVMFLVDKTKKDNVSVDVLIEQQMQEDVVQEQQVASSDEQKAEQEKQEGQKEEEVREGEDKGVALTQEQKSEIAVQVLNAGAITGAAAAVTGDFKAAGYKIISAKNSQNDYEGVVVYYGSEYAEFVNEIAAVVGEKYGAQKLEESSEVISKYDAHIVVVLGS